MDYLKKLPIIRWVYRSRIIMSAYHFVLANLGALRYGFPARKLFVIGVTGTKGKTSTSDILAQILQSSGRPTALATTVIFRVGDNERKNQTKQTMLGRLALHKFLHEAVAAGCRYAVVETSSEGILQHRHRGIGYRGAIFTNLSPEHIERHGSFEAYRSAKIKLFDLVARKKDGFAVYNLDDKNASYFIDPPVARRYGVTVRADAQEHPEIKKYLLANIRVGETSSFSLNNEPYATPLAGEFNVWNAALAAVAAQALGLTLPEIKIGLANLRPTPGRLERINKNQPFQVIVDYAHEPASLEAIYRAAASLGAKRLIGLLGAQGGGRDIWKRAAMGKIAAQFCDKVIVTNEDPYDDDPAEIIRDVARHVAGGKNPGVFTIADRREGIKKALSLAEPGDAVVLTGKGGEVWMCVAGGQKIAWNEKAVAEEELANLGWH